MLANLRPKHPLSGREGQITRRLRALSDRAIDALFDADPDVFKVIPEDVRYRLLSELAAPPRPMTL